MFKVILYIGIFFVLANCTNKVTYSGKILNQEELDDINFINKEKLISKLGYPSYIDPIENKFLLRVVVLKTMYMILWNHLMVLLKKCIMLMPNVEALKTLVYSLICQ